MEAKFKGAEQENSQLRREVDEHRACSTRRKSWIPNLLCRRRSWKRSTRGKWMKCTFLATAVV